MKFKIDKLNCVNDDLNDNDLLRSRLKREAVLSFVITDIWNVILPGQN